MITKKNKIHTRKIDIAIYDGSSSDSIVVEGALRDERMFQSRRNSGEIIPPGAIHHMIVRLVAKGPQLIIEDIEVEMPTIPNNDCKQTRERLAPMIGIPIFAGYSSKVKALIGGVNGCNHLLALMLAMGTAAVQGAFSLISHKAMESGVSNPVNLKRLKNTCWAWRENGPLMERYQ